MKWSTVVLGVGVGLLTYLLVKKDKTLISGEKALLLAKQAFSDNGNIQASWIHMVPERIEKNESTHHVYRGGITRQKATETEKLEFLIDSHSGEIIEASAVHKL